MEKPEIVPQSLRLIPVIYLPVKKTKYNKIDYSHVVVPDHIKCKHSYKWRYLNLERSKAIKNRAYQKRIYLKKK